MIVELRQKDAKYPDLTPNQHYVVLGIEADDFRILNDNGRPYLYPNEIFRVVDSREPDDWVTQLGEEGERYCYSSPLTAVFSWMRPRVSSPTVWLGG
ncbi:MAG: hypothetical protein ACREEM_33900, partial [Blastocatellia bacterium]